MGSDELRSVLDERLLVERARRDPAAFALLCRAYIDRVHAYAYRRTGSYESAEHVTFAAFERAWMSLPTLVDRPAEFEPWLMRILANELITHERRRRAAIDNRSARILRELEEDLLGDPVLANALRPPESERRVAEVRDALASRSPREQEILTLRFLSGLDAKQAAAAMGCSRAALLVAERRALRALDVESPRAALVKLAAVDAPAPRGVFMVELVDRMYEVMADASTGDLVPPIELALAPRGRREHVARRYLAATAALVLALAVSIVALSLALGSGATVEPPDNRVASAEIPAAAPTESEAAVRRALPPSDTPAAHLAARASGGDGWALVSWEPFAGDTFGGYVIARADGSAATEYEVGRIVDRTSVSFHDTQAGAGGHYRVVVVDAAGDTIARSDLLPVSPVTF